jgi:hypothetical protein
MSFVSTLTLFANNVNDEFHCLTMVSQKQNPIEGHCYYRFDHCIAPLLGKPMVFPAFLYGKTGVFLTETVYLFALYESS